MRDQDSLGKDLLVLLVLLVPLVHHSLFRVNGEWKESISL